MINKKELEAFAKQAAKSIETTTDLSWDAFIGTPIAFIGRLIVIPQIITAPMLNNREAIKTLSQQRRCF
jgi:hypothetical protein